MYRYNFNPYQIIHRNQWYRIISHAFLHADYMHLAINMFVLYSFGDALEYYLGYYFGSKKILYYLIIYFGSIIFSVLFSLFKNRNNVHYNAVGASGAVSAIVFACIFFAPMSKLLVFMILPVPGIVFAGLYLAYSYFMSRKANDFVAHDVHFWGAIFGFTLPLALDPSLIYIFIENLIP